MKKKRRFRRQVVAIASSMTLAKGAFFLTDTIFYVLKVVVQLL
jgi:hypothetical protein